MNINPVTISLIALIVSIISLLISSYRAGVDRKLQWEQLRGSVHSRLTSHGVELITMIDELRQLHTDEAEGLAKKLILIGQGIVDVRKRLRKMERPPLFQTSALITKVAPIKSDLDDAEPVFEELNTAIRKANFSKASEIADGLLKRIG